MVDLENNLKLLLKAVSNKDIQLVKCTDKAGKSAELLCVVSKLPNGVEFIPIAKMLDENPYMEYKYDGKK